ncbi:hypothetical protein V1260_13655 [Brachybacterium sp. J144]|uniref:hypothetical protein n=1 Tax=Brachybacterium sp. J144 TaxID=3116487 RepID=UPI002E788100|nr:hypothetical protein [Brachybacterium sp. J144]MEE1651824.1 hypothetical protein [Brachybacterium sp. J144]
MTYAPQPSAQQFPGPAPAPAKKGKAPMILMILGGVILVLSVIVGIVITVIGISSTAGGYNEIEVFESGSGSVTAEAGDVLQYYVPEGTAIPTCDITAPSEAAVGEGTPQTSSVSKDGVTWESFDSITANEAGEYTVDCHGTPVAVGPPVSIGGIFGAVGGIFLGLGGGFVGFVILLVGIILALLRRRKA